MILCRCAQLAFKQLELDLVCEPTLATSPAKQLIRSPTVEAFIEDGSPLVGGWMAEHVSYGAAFACAVLGEVVVIAALLLGRNALAAVETQSSLAALIGPVKTNATEEPHQYVKSFCALSG